MQRNNLGLLAAFLLGLMSIADAQAPEQILTPHYPWGATGSGQFGQAVGLSGSTLAVGSNEWDPAFTADGRVTVYERSPSGRWQFSQVLTRQPYFSIPSACGGCFGHGIEIVGDSMMVKGDAHVDSCWEFQRVGGIWTPHEQIGATTAP